MQSTDLKGRLPFVAKGKVRELYELPGDRLLFVATDRISAYDVILNNPIPGKGKILTGLSLFWFDYLKDVLPNHLAKDQSLPSNLTEDPAISKQLDGRSLIVQKLKVIPLEVIVRGYITGSAWSEYQKSGTVHGIKMPAGLKESEKFPDGPIYTPSTKAEFGEHDENISPEHAEKIVGKEVAKAVETAALKLYQTAHEYALKHGIIIADTKFEFGIDSAGNIVLADEVLTPDSSRFWPKDTYEVGKTPDSFDKQYLRNWLTSHNLKGKEDVTIPEDIVEKTVEKYEEVRDKLTNK